MSNKNSTETWAEVCHRVTPQEIGTIRTYNCKGEQEEIVANTRLHSQMKTKSGAPSKERGGTKIVFDQSKVRNFFLTNQVPKSLCVPGTAPIKPIKGHRQHTALRTMRQYNVTSSNMCARNISYDMRLNRPKSPTRIMIVRREQHRPSNKDMADCRIRQTQAENDEKAQKMEQLARTNNPAIASQPTINCSPQFKSFQHHKLPE